MTIHAAKGLEFPVVAVADLGREPNSGAPDVLVDGERIGLRLVTLGGKAKTAAYEALREERQEREREEALRVLYVAMTRARDRLILSGAANLAAASGRREPAADRLARAGAAGGGRHAGRQRPGRRDAAPRPHPLHRGCGI